MPGGPPSQAGKFKPRKPAKKIRVGATSDQPTAPPMSSSSAAAASGGAHEATKRGGGGGRGGRGRGGGRGGTGRGMRAPLPQGQVFFTAQPAPTPSSRVSGARGNSSSAATAKQRVKAGILAKVKREQQQSSQPEEEIVTTLEEGVGSSQAASVPDKVTSQQSSGGKADKNTAMLERAMMLAGGEQGDFSGVGGSGAYSAHAMADIMYDSDSSMEGTSGFQDDRQRGLQGKEPLTLPLVSPPEDATTMAMTGQSDQPSAIQTLLQADNEKNDSWFLVQLPTRLPPIMQQHEIVPNTATSTGAADGTNETSTMGEVKVVKGFEETAMVATAPMQVNAFDNSLSGAAAGRMGKLRIYKSGRAVLVLGGGGDVGTTSEIEMDVTEGISCGFQQQAVVIDIESSNKRYVPLGSVGKTLVITPKLESSTSDN